MISKILLASALSLLITSNANAQEAAPVTDPTIPVLSPFNKVLAIAPMQFTENGVGLAVSYEQAVDKEAIVAFILPVIVTFNLAHDQKYGNKQDAMFYFMPGIKFYPTGGFGKIKYAIGPSLVLGAGQKTEPVYNPIVPEYKTRSNFLLGIMVNNSINFNATPHFYLGLDFGFGFTYIHKLDGENQGINGIVEGGLKLGYRF
ncbi:hypothetical protein CJD36_019405 [Flavipsychrobacter stenotrophus]|uniref:DUF3575 domain-containing protein n=1 Tax=Flavipsychrobacter stenotrophus TaxID=2077091 RepID=A0A2S7SS09_9BACT|nr:hypothetical protein [Flavipsychrobacter stenotrophus]PQJ09411.1 hypothetical protein CJD36_019405 [Flavipsychrobacter stenotrophus]